VSFHQPLTIIKKITRQNKPIRIPHNKLVDAYFISSIINAENFFSAYKPAKIQLLYLTFPYRKGADLIITHALTFSVSPNTAIKRTEENNHPTPLRYDDRGRIHFRPCSYTKTAKGASFTRVLLMDSEIWRF